MMRYVYSPYAGLCSRKVMTSELNDFSELSFTHPLGCCDGGNIMQYCSDFIDDYENNSVLNVLTTWAELNKIGITPVTEKKLIGYLKGRISDFMKNNTEFMQTPDLAAFGAEKEKKGLSVKLLFQAMWCKAMAYFGLLQLSILVTCWIPTNTYPQGRFIRCRPWSPT